MKMKKPTLLIFVVVILGIILLSLYFLVNWYFTPITTIEKPEPTLTDENLTADLSPFINAGCVKEGYFLNCSSINLEEKYSCRWIYPPSDYLSSLSPKVPIVECIVEYRDQEQVTKKDGIVREGCMVPFYRKYIVFSNGEFKLINNKEEFIQFFAPVETPEEALSFAVALTHSAPMYDINIPKHYRVFVSKIEPTYVKETEEGFKVHLFSYATCGCGPHPYYAVDYLVKKTGEVSQIAMEKIYEDPAEDSICTD